MKKSVSKQLFSLAKSSLGEFIVGIAFSKFSKYLPIKKVKETDKAIAFWHPKPFWQKHILIVPKKPIKTLLHLNEEDKEYIVEVYKIAGGIVKELSWEKEGYTLSTNGGKRQEVAQLHFHLWSGKQIE